jgi:UDPglucose 6-dehydrogenase
MENTMKLRIGIVGHGFVGKAVDFGFCRNVEKFIVDPILKTKVSDLLQHDPSIVFIAVPTPSRDDGSIDSTILESVFSEVRFTCPRATIVVKSTCTPDIIDRLAAKADFIYNPEFLTEAHANHDFVNASSLILGASGNNSAQIEEVEHAYVNHSSCKQCPVVRTSAKTASFIKYATNTFLAAKVVFFNELKRLYDAAGENNWAMMTGALTYDKRMGWSHMLVPGPDGRKGFGGACFPKDTEALLHYAETLGVGLTVLDTAVDTNKEIRREYDEPLEREKAQNIKFG